MGDTKRARFGSEPGLRARARALCARGRALVDQDRWQEAEPILLEALKISGRAFRRDTLEVADTLNRLGICYKYLARFTEAGPLYQRALGIVERRVGPADERAATLYHNLGGLEHAAGNWARGERFARRSVLIRRGAVGAAHPALASDMIALAALLDPQKKYDESERLYSRAIAILERAYGPEHPEIAVALNNLAAVHQARGRPQRAEAMYRRALAIGRSRLGGGNPKVASYAHNLAVLLASRGCVDEAAMLFRQTLEVFRRALGPRHPSVGVCLEHYAAVLRTLRRRAEAAACERRARRIFRRVDATSSQHMTATATINPQCARFRLAVKPSRIDRLGVFAEDAIPAGRGVIEYVGERIGRREAKRRSNSGRSYLFRLDSRVLVDGAVGGGGAEYINHSCEPNLATRRLRGHIVLFSRRRIAPGEELTLDYRYSSRLDPIPCSCGAPTCRGTMTLPPV